MKNIVKVISFFCILTVCLLFFSNTLQASVANTSTSRNQVNQSIKSEFNNSLDVLFMGDSTILNSVVPIDIWKHIGVTSFSVGYGWAKPSELYYDYKKILKTQSPKYLFLESSILVNSVKNDKYLINKSTNFINYLDDEIYGQFNTLFPIMKYKSSLKDGHIIDIFKSKPKELRNIYKGYSFKNKIVDTREQETENTLEDLGYIDNSETYIKKLNKLCIKNNCQLILVLMPQKCDWSMTKHKLVENLANRLNISFIDYNVDTEKKIVGFNWDTDSADGGYHLNYTGAKKTTIAMEQYLANTLKIKPTALTAEQKKRWNEDSELFYRFISDNS